MGRSSSRSVTASLLVSVLLLGGGIVPSARAAPAPLPLVDDGKFVLDLSAPVLAPGDSGTMSTVLEVAVYAFNAYPGNASGPAPAGALTLAAQGGTGENLSLQEGTVVPGAPVPVAVRVSASASAPSGTFALRLALEFVANGSTYELASRGAFSDAQWGAATVGPNGTTTLNVSRLGVSGVLPETAVLVRANPFPLVLAVILSVALVLAAAGGYYAFRAGPGSRSGAATPDDPSHAPTALGKRRRRDGD
ncbi:MAG: hypothetical protein L3J91_02995 [Thermoplasmata archaeon]|nr:hypothetical protein [Thermoplasmata archaeon]